MNVIDEKARTAAEPAAGGVPALQVRHRRVSFRMRKDRTTVVRGVDLTLERGEIVAVVGESGSGKSVFAKSLMGLLPPSAEVSGDVDIAGRSLVTSSDYADVRGRVVSMVFQDPLRALNPVLTIGFQLCEVLQVRLGMSKATARERAIELLREVRIDRPEFRMKQYPHQLSGGMRQRVVIAIAAACNPALLIADEPTTALDVSVQGKILDVLVGLVRDHGTAIILVTHDIALASTVADRVIVMYAGRVVETGPMREVIRDPRMPYTQALVGAARAMEEPTGGKLPTITGEPARVSTLRRGCPFEPRCSRSELDCLDTEPDLIVLSGGRSAACLHAGTTAMKER